MDFVRLRKWGEEETPSHGTPERSAFHRDSTMARKMLLNRTGRHNVQRRAPPQLPALRVSTMEHLFQDKQPWVLLDNGLPGPPPRHVAKVGKCGQQQKGRTLLRGTECASYSVFPWKKTQANLFSSSGWMPLPLKPFLLTSKGTLNPHIKVGSHFKRPWIDENRVEQRTLARLLWYQQTGWAEQEGKGRTAVKLSVKASQEPGKSICLWVPKASNQDGTVLDAVQFKSCPLLQPGVIPAQTPHSSLTEMGRKTPRFMFWL